MIFDLEFETSLVISILEDKLILLYGKYNLTLSNIDFRRKRYIYTL